MNDVYIVYFSETGNTETMAKAVGAGVTEAGGNAILEELGSASADKLKEAGKIALGCPACGAEELDEDMKTLMEELSGSLDNKTVGLFGSFGWGGGDWMRDWETQITKEGGTIAGGEGIIVNGEPDDEILKACENLGKELAI